MTDAAPPVSLCSDADDVPRGVGAEPVPLAGEDGGGGAGVPGRGGVRLQPRLRAPAPLLRLL